jgi:hypothetical protein
MNVEELSQYGAPGIAEGGAEASFQQGASITMQETAKC